MGAVTVVTTHVASSHVYLRDRDGTILSLNPMQFGLDEDYSPMRERERKENGC